MKTAWMLLVTALLGAACGGVPDVRGTVWELAYALPDELDDPMRYTVYFAQDGLLETDNPRDVTPGNDTWYQDGTHLHFFYNNAFTHYDGVWTDGTFRGEAVNNHGTHWPFVLRGPVERRSPPEKDPPTPADLTTSLGPP